MKKLQTPEKVQAPRYHLRAYSRLYVQYLSGAVVGNQAIPVSSLVRLEGKCSVWEFIFKSSNLFIQLGSWPSAWHALIFFLQNMLVVQVQ